ncbi:hypothetical protein AMV169 [Betaentomopoxvirus amoorei]|uniref:AMV169 n=1 Tax=Amsacta moorei entomopoxvirus TaxID=28321 RepID=Q9EMN0_AMEPV|nr:hypothetical protein AMV169 [Amsacta moorei entomopoxvirus]AAG02875.1 AMV169 [Amsacta moorei entomopoxvirus]
MSDQYTKLLIVLIFYYMLGFIIGHFICEFCFTIYESYNKYKEEKNEEDKLLIINTIKDTLEPYKELFDKLKANVE